MKHVPLKLRQAEWDLPVNDPCFFVLIRIGPRPYRSLLLEPPRLHLVA